MQTFREWVAVAISAISALVAIGALAYQISRSRFTQSIDLLFRLENDFFGDAKRSRRSEAARGIAKNEPEKAEHILDFFETVALLLRKKALDPEMVWHTFYYWIGSYYGPSSLNIRPMTRSLGKILSAWPRQCAALRLIGLEGQCHPALRPN